MPDSYTVVVPVVKGREAEAALTLARVARNLLREAGARKAHRRLAEVIPSMEGATRAQEYRRNRAAEKEIVAHA